MLGVAAGQLDNAGGVGRLESGQLPAVDAQGGARGVALQAAALAATAGAPVGLDIDVPDLGGEAGGPAHEAAVDDDGAAHPGPQGDDQDIALAGPRAEPRLRPAGRIGVVLDDDGQAHALGHDVADAHAGPVQVGARGHGVAVRGDEAGGADAHGDRLRAGLLQLQGAVDDGVQDARAVIGRGGPLDALQDGALLVHDPGGDLRAAHVHTDTQCHVHSSLRSSGARRGSSDNYRANCGSCGRAVSAPKVLFFCAVGAGVGPAHPTAPARPETARRPEPHARDGEPTRPAQDVVL